MNFSDRILYWSKKNQYSGLVNDYSAGIQQVFSTIKYRKVLNEWVGLRPGPKKILDVGCGDGLFTNFLQEYSGGVQITGIDNSKDMIMSARDKYPTIDFRVESMEKMSLPDHEVDFVFSRFAVHYSVDLKATLKEIGRVTKPGGLFFVKEVHPFYATFLKNSLDYEQKEKVTFKTQGDTGVSVTHPTFTLDEYSRAFTFGGWKIKGIHEFYGKEANGEKVAPFRVPTSICFVLIKK